jgi:hypothetical protein
LNIYARIARSAVGFLVSNEGNDIEHSIVVSIVENLPLPLNVLTAPEYIAKSKRKYAERKTVLGYVIAVANFTPNGLVCVRTIFVSNENC